MDGRTCVAIFTDRMRAEMMRELLIGEGIPVLLRSDDGGGVRPELAFSRGVRLDVPDEDRERALEILREYGAAEFAELRDDQ